MAAYAGTTTVLWSISIGNKRMSLASVAVTNYNSSGIPLTPAQFGMDYIEFVIGLTTGFNDGNAPDSFVLPLGNQVCLLYKAPNTPVPNDVNLNSAIGPILFLVVGA
jgi:hypothetical protein